MGDGVTGLEVILTDAKATAAAAAGIRASSARGIAWSIGDKETQAFSMLCRSNVMLCF